VPGPLQLGVKDGSVRLPPALGQLTARILSNRRFSWVMACGQVARVAVHSASAPARG